MKENNWVGIRAYHTNRSYMKKISFYLIFILAFSVACAQEQQNTSSPPSNTIANTDFDYIDTSGYTIESRFVPPRNFQRPPADSSSFAAYLRQLPLKPAGSPVLYYNGESKMNHDVYDAVVDLSIGRRDLHQCADAIMRLRAEYLWTEKQYDQIHFNFTNGFRVNFSEWMIGKRIVVKGNHVSWDHSHLPAKSYNSFWKYMETIFAYAGTLSLEKELNPIDISDLQIGDIFIQGGSPGHAIIVVDLAHNPITNEKIFLLAQSYMPAQEIQILKNPNNSDGNPWYSADFGDILNTPEWTFRKGDLKRF